MHYKYRPQIYIKILSEPLCNTLFRVNAFSEWGRVNPLHITTAACDGSFWKFTLPYSCRPIVLGSSLERLFIAPYAVPFSVSLSTFTWSNNVFGSVRLWGRSDTVICLDPQAAHLPFLPGPAPCCHCWCRLLCFLSTFLLLTFPFTLAFCV